MRRWTSEGRGAASRRVFRWRPRRRDGGGAPDPVRFTVRLAAWALPPLVTYCPTASVPPRAQCYFNLLLIDLHKTKSSCC
ncbi:hypothetical protein GUJ93_ZPchr0006g43018 [Zizania palustris]|uniref:Uncharacterized protein n=1 Tax=Zizania palustris TaxID=103762 RepID=A0A8J5SK55_ZIZPA|nr:hypothetical protein GUJ93_ZPchr0006g43018 [Zizania palustris]